MNSSILLKVKTFDQSVQLIIAILAGVLLGGVSILFPPIAVLALIVIPVFTLAFIYRPEYGVLTIIILTCTFVPENNLPTVNVGPLRIFINEIIVIFLFVLFILRWLIDKDFHLTSSPLGVPLIGFWGWAILSATVGLLVYSNNIGFVIPEVRTISFYLLFFPIIYLITNERGIKSLINGILFLATVVAVGMIVQEIVGSAFRILPVANVIEPLITEGEFYSSVPRVFGTIGESLITIAIITKTVILFTTAFKPRTVLNFIQWILFAIGLVLTFSRTHWLVVGFAVFIAFIMVRGKERQRFLFWVLFMVYLSPLIYLPIYFNPDSKISNTITAAVDRITSVGTKKAYVGGTDVSTISWRLFEYKYAIPQSISHPIIGLGLGAFYRPLVDRVDDEWQDMRGYIHNGHLWIAMKTGLVGYLFFLWLSVVFIWRGFKYWRYIPDPWLKGVYLGFTLSFLSAFLVANLHLVFMITWWSVMLGTIMGINEVILKLNPSISKPA